MKHCVEESFGCGEQMQVVMPHPRDEEWGGFDMEWKKDALERHSVESKDARAASQCRQHAGSKHTTAAVGGGAVYSANQIDAKQQREGRMAAGLPSRENDTRSGSARCLRHCRCPRLLGILEQRRAIAHAHGCSSVATRIDPIAVG